MLGTSIMATLFHPFIRTHALVQVGHEPLPPTLGRTLFGRPAYMLPGPLAYARHIAQVDGVAGLFSGLAPRLCQLTVGNVVHRRVQQRLRDADVVDQRAPEDHGMLQLLRDTTKEMIARSCSTVVSYPFRLIAMRCMVQFALRGTTEYGSGAGVLDSVLDVYRAEGILGFFAGLIPCLLGGALSLWLSRLLAHAVEVRTIDARDDDAEEKREFVQAVTEFSANQITYPFMLVSNLMQVRSCGLPGGLPRHASWTTCLRRLYEDGNLFRGVFFHFRSFREASGGS